MAKFIVRAVQVITQNVVFEVDVPDHFDGNDVDDQAGFAATAITDFRNENYNQFISLEDSDDETVLQNIVCEVEEVK